MTTEECFEAAVQVENLMRDVYAGLAARYRGDPAKVKLFRGLAAEEEQHAQRIRLLARHQDGGAWAEKTAARIAESLGQMSTRLLAVVAELGEDSEGAPREDLLRRVMDAEDVCSSIHAEVLAETGDIDVQLLFSALAKQDVRHKELLGTALGA
jgi:rubrerythrin